MNATTQSDTHPRKDGRAWAIRVLFSAGEVTRPDPYFLPEGVTMIGRAPEDVHDLCFDADSAMSRHHASLEHAGGILTLRDHSRNGSEINGEPAVHKALRSGDLIRCGDTFAVARLEPILADDAPVRGLLGVSAVAQQVRAAIAEVATTPSAVHLHGEPGTGKSIAARAIHILSGRPHTWTQLNCAALPEGFAQDTHPQGGTLFIDEVGALSERQQRELLALLDADGGRLADARIISASQRELGSEVHEGTFSLDLHARLATVVIWLPPLRERIEDLLGVLCDQLGDHPQLCPSLVDDLLRYHWPHNFREVERIATELAVRGAGYEVLVPELIEEHLQSSLLRPPPTVPSQQPPPQRPQPPPAEALKELLQHHRGDVASVAAALGQSHSQLGRWLSQHAIDPTDYRV